jgi:hypothetical protein
MKTFSQSSGVMVLSCLMDLHNDEKAESPGGAAQDQPNLWDLVGSHSETPGWDAAALETVPEGCRGNPLRQLWWNLLAGLRVAFFFRVGADRFCATAGALASLAFTDLFLNLLVSLALVGRRGFFSYSSLPGFFFHIPLLMLFGLWASLLLSRPSLVRVIPVALIALSIPIELCHAILEGLAQLQQLKWLELYLDSPHYYRFFTWWTLAALFFLYRLQAPSRSRRSWGMVLFLVLVLPPLWIFPRSDLWVSSAQNGESGELHLTEDVLWAQPKLLEGELAGLKGGRRGVSELYFVGFAGDGTQDVFLKELKTTAQLFADRFGTGGRSVVLANNPQTATTLPFATAGNLERALVRVGQVMNRDEDVAVLFLTSHGSSDHELSVNNRPLELEPLGPKDVSAMLAKSGIKWKIVVVSACYSGGFIDALKDDRSLIITAADADHESFGCGNGEDLTWFGHAFIDAGLRHTYSFTKAFEKARETIRQWEEKEGETPSNPQIWLGREMRPKLAALEKRLKAEAE